MANRTKTYFVADVHLGSKVSSPQERQERFVGFLRSINNEETKAIYLLGDIWDFWYEYKYVVPKHYFQVFSAIENLILGGIEVYFMEGNHDVWTFSYLEEIGVKKIVQPTIINLDGKTFLLGHGDLLGKLPFGLRVMNGLFHSKIAQFFFSLLHPTLAFSLGNAWSTSNKKRRKNRLRPELVAENLPIYEYSKAYLKHTHIDHFIYGHFHIESNIKLAENSELHIVKDWFKASPYLVWDTISVLGGYFQNIE